MGVIGSIVTWSLRDVNVPVRSLREAMRENAFDPEWVRDMLPRHAFSRAAKHLEEHRIIRRVQEERDHLLFQFTAEHRDASQMKYQMECVLALNKTTGEITVASDGGRPEPAIRIRDAARAKLAEASASRCTADVTRLLQRIFAKADVDLIPIRKAGGVYLVMNEQTGFLDRIDKLLRRLADGQALSRFPVEGSGGGKVNAAEAIRAYIQNLIEEQKQAVEELTGEERSSTKVRAGERLDALSLKIEAYASFLDDAKAVLSQSVKEVKQTLRSKLLVSA